MTSKDMDNLQRDDPARFKALCDQLVAPDPQAHKPRLYRNGVLVDEPIPTND
jgi:hypothetical protein